MTFNTCLLKVPMFQDLDHEILHHISKLIQPKILQPNDSLFLSGDTINNLYILHQGALVSYTVSEDGIETVLRSISIGDFLGEDALIRDEIATLNIKASQPSHVCVIDGQSFRNLLKISPDISLSIIDALLSRIHQSEQSQIEALSLSARQRILNALHALGKPHHPFSLNQSKKDFAASINMTPETLSRNLKQLEKDKLIHQSGQRTITLLISPENE